MKNQEIERRFLLPPCRVKKLLKYLNIKASKKRFIQFYLPDKRWSIRYRQIENRYIRTIKIGEGLIRQEIEKEVSKKEFKKAFKRSVGVAIIKDRYSFFYKGNFYELDSFKGELKGLVMLEIEFKDLKSAKEFTLPKALGKITLRELTDDRNFTNHSLALNGLPKLSKKDFKNLKKEAKKRCKKRQ